MNSGMLLNNLRSSALENYQGKINIKELSTVR